MQIENLLNGKKVLMIPVYSARSYKTGIYDLAADGNVTKFLMKIITSNAESFDILYPSKSIHLDFATDILKKCKIKNVNWIKFDYGKNAHETRISGDCFINKIKELFTDGHYYDIIISEVDTLAQLCIKNNYEFCNTKNFVYWAGSWNADGTRWDEQGHHFINKEIAANVITPCLLKGQPQLYKGKSFYDICNYKPEIFDKTIIFFPFRLSDESYKADYFLKTMQNLMQERNDFVVLFTDPNDSGLWDNEDENVFIKVPKNKYVYLSILKGQPIIPFFDNPEINYHTNIFEFLYYKCNIITFENDLCKEKNIDNVTFIKNIQEFPNELRRRINNGK